MGVVSRISLYRAWSGTNNYYCVYLKSFHVARKYEVLMSTGSGRFIPGRHAMASFYPRGMVIIAGNSHKQLAEDVARSVFANYRVIRGLGRVRPY